MKKILELITEELEQAFADAGYEKELARVTLSNRPDLCEYQCNGAMAGAKKYHKAPIMIAEEVVAKIPESFGMERQQLEVMVKEINETEVAAEEVLSDTVYYYDREMESISM